MPPNTSSGVLQRLKGEIMTLPSWLPNMGQGSRLLLFVCRLAQQKGYGNGTQTEHCTSHHWVASAAKRLRDHPPP